MIALVVLNYNDYNTTEKFLESAKKLDKVNIIIVVDNCSNDNSYNKLLKLVSTKIVVIRTQMNGGYASGNNFGIKYAISNFKADIIIVSNPDVEIPESTINATISFLNKSQDIGIVSGKMMCPSRKSNVAAWKLPRYKDCVMENFFGLKKLFGSRINYPKSYWNNNIVQVDVVSGSFFVIKANTLENVSFFDEDTFLYYEENILAFKLKNKGYKNYILTNRPYIHNHSVSINRSISSTKDKLNIEHKSRKTYCKKYLKINKIQEIILDFAYKIGASNYLLYCKLFKR